MTPRPIARRVVARRVVARGSWAAAALWSLALSACGVDGPDTEPEPEGERFDVAVGRWDPDAETFEALADGAPVELVAGFQGLIFVNLALRAERDVPARYIADGEIVFEDVDERYPFYDPQVLFEPVGDTSRVVPSFRVPFGLPASELDGRMVRFDLRLESHRDDWWAETSVRFRIHDGDCVHTPEGEFVCD